MPHLVILYTGNLESQTDISLLCRSLADAMLSVRDEHSHSRSTPPAACACSHIRRTTTRWPTGSVTTPSCT